jgi:hypothetical protein
MHGKTTKEEDPHEKESREKKSKIIGGALISGTPCARFNSSKNTALNKFMRSMIITRLI